tara:strand:+ start:321 stop:473 length:153 start_codon:yes stop_codon:yes gene_type:complete
VYQNNKKQQRGFFNHFLKIIKPRKNKNFWWAKVGVLFLYIFLTQYKTIRL